MLFYTVDARYIAFLQTIDGKVPNSSGIGYKHEKPYVGVVLEIGNHKFLAPLTSYKANQDSIPSSRCSAFKLHARLDPTDKLGLIALSYMIPVIDNQIALLNIASQDAKYQTLIHKQFEFIKQNEAEILLRAAKLYDHIVNKRTEFFVRVSCDIPTLIDRYKDFAPVP